MIIRSRAPVRLSFAGGATDLSPFTETNGGCVVSTTINKYIYGTLLPRPDDKVQLFSADYKKNIIFKEFENINYDGDLDLMKAIVKLMQPHYGFELSLRSDIPPNTGLGSSGSVGVAITGLFNYLKEEKLNHHEIAEMAYKAETEELKFTTGRQDMYASTFGGLNFIEFKGNNFVRVNPIKIPEDAILELEKHLILAYIGNRGESYKIQKLLTEQKQGYSEEIKQKSLKRKTITAKKMKIALEQGDLNKFSDLLNQDWEEKKQLHPGYINEKLENIYNTAIKSGALCAKTTGAGIGGHMIIFCKNNKEHIVTKELENIGVRSIDFSFETGGLKTWSVKQKWQKP